MTHHGALAFLAVLGFAASGSALSATIEVELLIIPSAFVVDGRAYDSAKAAVDAALSKRPDVLSLPACSAMKSQRVLDVMAELQGRFTGRVLMKSLAPMERDCPDFK